MAPDWVAYVTVVILELFGLALILFASGYAVWGGLRSERKPHRVPRIVVTVVGQIVIALPLWWHIAHLEQPNLPGWARFLFGANTALLALSPLLTARVIYTIRRDKTPTRRLW